MRYTIQKIDNGRKWDTPIETDDLQEALRIKRRNNLIYVGVVTIITDNQTGKEVVTKRNYYGETKVYGNYIKMY